MANLVASNPCNLGNPIICSQRGTGSKSEVKPKEKTLSGRATISSHICRPYTILQPFGVGLFGHKRRTAYGKYGQELKAQPQAPHIYQLSPPELLSGHNNWRKLYADTATWLWINSKGKQWRPSLFALRLLICLEKEKENEPMAWKIWLLKSVKTPCKAN